MILSRILGTVAALAMVPVVVLLGIAYALLYGMPDPPDPDGRRRR